MTDITAPQDTAGENAEAVRRARFGVLPARIRPEDTVQELPATVPDPARDSYDSDDWLVRTCA